jgi:glycosyltransferase involved in cell wall biosynthesis
MLREIAAGVATAPMIIGGYAYGVYPILLSALARGRPGATCHEPATWPMVTIVVPVFNEEQVIGDMLRHLLALDYPSERMEILVVSDASTDGTDDVVREFTDHGVRLLRMPVRKGKTAGENAAGGAVRGDIIVNIDASIRVPRHALRALVSAFDDPSVGVASGRDVTVGAAAARVNRGEGRYTDYEMRVRALETRIHSIVGASGCFFATRRELYRLPFPEHLSRDFGSALVARLHGYRAVAVEEAICFVPCSPSLAVERRRKMRTMTRGIGTLWYMRALLDPRRYGIFSWMLFSHKLCRWAVPASIPFAAVAVGVLALSPEPDLMRTVARAALAAGAGVAAAAAMTWRLAMRRALPRWLSLPVFISAAIVAGIQAWAQWAIGRQNPLWDPTRRVDAPAAT